MRVEFKDNKTLIIIPELSIEEIMLAKFDGGTVSVEKSCQMRMNIKRLVILAALKEISQ